MMLLGNKVFMVKASDDGSQTSCQRLRAVKNQAAIKTLDDNYLNSDIHPWAFRVPTWCLRFFLSLYVNAFFSEQHCFVMQLS